MHLKCYITGSYWKPSRVSCIANITQTHNICVTYYVLSIWHNIRSYSVLTIRLNLSCARHIAFYDKIESFSACDNNIIYTRNARYTYNNMYAVHNACVFGRKFYSKIMLFDTSYSAAVVVLCEFSVLKLNYKNFRSHSRLSHYILFRWQINFLAPLFLRRSLSPPLSLWLSVFQDGINVSERF